MNHSRCCAYDNGTRSGRSRTTNAERAPPASVSRPAKAAGVDASNNSRSGTSTPNTARIRLTNRTANSEWPPSWKKSSSAPTPSSPSTCANAPHTSSSRTVAGPRPTTPPPPYSGTGNARRSTFPFAVNGNASSTTTADGTMYSGSRAPTNPRTAPATSPPGLPPPTTTYATSRLSPGTSSRATTSACSTPGCDATTASTSPGSIRNPRIFTCSSARPANTNRPSAVHRTRSPVRYIRSPSANGHATNRSADSPARPT
ncbi:hypothetical protein GCM10022403_005880 [Streptomyces coacervatus]|uniref:Uncharacterized protein n=1 Tax=Streptomyces coacervatus TaxID=647381 RepID=A0ABP7GSY1_9ACTN